MYERRLNFKQANFDAINEYLGSFEWDTDLAHVGVEDAVGILNDRLEYAIGNFVPMYSVRESSYPR